jgi:hypothetical protein
VLTVHDVADRVLTCARCELLCGARPPDRVHLAQEDRAAAARVHVQRPHPCHPRAQPPGALSAPKPSQSVPVQTRAFTCIGLILAMRALNLLVPAFYGKMVDRLADVTSDVRARPPISHAFKSVFFPWVAAYLAARFLQGGGALWVTLPAA